MNVTRESSKGVENLLHKMFIATLVNLTCQEDYIVIDKVLDFIRNESRDVTYQEY